MPKLQLFIVITMLAATVSNAAEITDEQLVDALRHGLRAYHDSGAMKFTAERLYIRNRSGTVR